MGILTELDDDSDCEFTIAEIAEMGNHYNQTEKGSVSQQLCVELATKFSCSARRFEKSCIKWEQVYDWFKDIKRESESRMLALQQEENLTEINGENYEICLHDMDSKKDNRGRKAKNIIPFAMMADNRPPLPRGELIAELPELIFEAKSARDFAWFDVAAFLNHRITYLGELPTKIRALSGNDPNLCCFLCFSFSHWTPEVRVRFNGFDYDHDEWVNVTRGVRERSIPLEHSECHRVDVGDLVLCYRDAEHFCLYYDAYVVDIQRNEHEDNTCTCIFVVQYDYDNFEEKIPAGRLCYRPAKKSPNLLELNL